MPTAKLTYLLPIGLAALILSGCGSDDDNFFGSGGSSSRGLSVFEFVNSYDKTSSNIAIAKIERNFSQGQYRVTRTNIVRNYNGVVPSSADNIVVAEGFEGLQANKNITVSGRTVEQPIDNINTSTNGSGSLKFSTTYEAYDLAGCQARDFADNAVNNKCRKVRTALNDYVKIPNTAAFPNGSICYIPVTTTDKNIWLFDKDSRPIQGSINDWINDTKNLFGNSKKPQQQRFDVGNKNEYRSEQIKFAADSRDPEYVYYGIDYKNRVYDNLNYWSAGKTQANTNNNVGVVDCTLINDTAADFLQQKIQQYY
ncbi:MULTISPECIES: hypothetical protein [Psychrobacter]|uniref:hypothetical protein n=1 Tax=Psychrobacter TaxID=497 RepID=UPI00146E530F|nr:MULTISPECIES: hypothetical protein [Psychrobacter]